MFNAKTKQIHFNLDAVLRKFNKNLVEFMKENLFSNSSLSITRRNRHFQQSPDPRIEGENSKN